MRSTFLLQGFLAFLVASLFLATVELVLGKHDLLQFSSGSSSGILSHAEDLPEAWVDTTDIGNGIPGAKDSLLVHKETAVPNEMFPPDPLTRFYEALHQLRQQPDASRVRIAYFGDSMIEGDLVTQTLRNDLQEIFGGEGVGFVPTNSKLWGYRKTIRQRFDEEQWFSYNVLGRKPSSYEYGISGELFLTKGWRPWLTFNGTDEYSRTRHLHQARIFYGPVTQEDAYCLVETDLGKDTVKLVGQQLVNAVTLADSCGEELGVRIVSGDKFPVYGLSIHSPTGLILDNFGMRNSTGSRLARISEESLRLFQNDLRYDLVVLQFGLNLVSADRTDFSRYEEALRQVVARFKVNMPDADILVVSVGDKCSRIGGHWQTDPSIPLIIETQEKVAFEMGVEFLNLFEEMGGQNTMVRWVNANPSLARGDYAHPNRRGAERVSALLRDYLLRGYEAYSGESVRTDGVALAR